MTDLTPEERDDCLHPSGELMESGTIWCPDCRREISTDGTSTMLYDEDDDA